MDYTAKNRPNSRQNIKRAGLLLVTTLCLGLLSPFTSAVYAQTPPSTEPAQTPPATAPAQTPPATAPAQTPPATTPAQTPPATAPAQTQPNDQANPVAQKLYGQWLAKDSNGKPRLVFLFTPEGKLYIMPPPQPNQPPKAAEMGYKINSTTKPMHLDVQLDANRTVLTVFEFTEEGKMNLQLEGTEAGLPRPAALTESATIFEKISDTTTLPPNTELKSSK